MFQPFDLANLVTTAQCGNTTCHILDQSVQVLGKIFGASAYSSIPNINLVSNLPSPNSIVSDIVGYFDLAIAAFMVFLYGYILVQATVNTAHDGKAFGQRNHTTWTLIRSILGPAFLLPKMSTVAGTVKGFSLLQGILMWCVLSGVSMADYVWSHAVNEIFHAPPANIPAEVNNIAAQELAKVFVYGAVANTINPNKPITQAIKITLPSDSSQPLINYDSKTINDKKTFSLIMSRLISTCTTSAKMNMTDGREGDAKALCRDAVDVLSGHKPGKGVNGPTTTAEGPMSAALYPWAVGRSSPQSNWNGDVYNQGSIYNDDPDAAQYMQFIVGFGDSANAENGEVRLSGFYNIAPISAEKKKMIATH